MTRSEKVFLESKKGKKIKDKEKEPNPQAVHLKMSMTDF
jgi:hypothetical protein